MLEYIHTNYILKRSRPLIPNVYMHEWQKCAGGENQTKYLEFQQIDR